MRASSYATLLILCCLLQLAAGCKREPESPTGSAGGGGAGETSAPAGASDVDVVRGVLAELLKRDKSQIRPEHSFKDLAADELDLVEAVMELEDRLKISIPDEAIERAAGTSKPADLLPRLTVAKLAAVVSEARQTAVPAKSFGASTRTSASAE